MSETKTTVEKMWVPVQEIGPNPNQPRKYFDEEALERLAVSLRKKQNQPVTVVPHPVPRGKVKWMIVDGERRWRASQAAGVKQLWVIVDSDVATESEVHEVGFAANWCREGHTHKETAEAIDLLVQQGKTYLEIAQMVGKSEAWSQKEHLLLKLHPDLLELLDPPTPKAERLPSAVAFALTAYPEKKQLGLWKKHKAQGKAAFHHIRTAAPRVSERSRGDDVRYVKGRAGMACSILKQLQALPVTMLRSLTVEAREEVAERLRTAATEATAFADLLVAAGAGEGVDE